MASVTKRRSLLIENNALTERPADVMATVMQAVARKLRNPYRLSEAIGVALGDVLRALNADAGSVRILNRASGDLLLVAQQGLPDAFVAASRVKHLGEGFAGRVASLGKPMRIDDFLRDPRVTQPELKLAGFRALLTVPIRVRGETTGTISAYARGDRRYRNTDRELLLSVANQIGMAIEITSLRQLLRERSKALRNSQQTVSRVFMTQEADWKRLAADLHDDVVQLMHGSFYEIEAGRKLIADPVRALQHLQTSVDLLNESISVLRKICSSLQSPSVRDMNLDSAIRQHLAEFERRTGIHTQLIVRGHPARLGAQNEMTAFRIFEEALRNVQRHADAPKVTVLLSHSRQRTSLEVHDFGIGFDPARPVSDSRLGLVAMRDRAQSIGAELRVRSAPGQGTRLSLRVPSATRLRQRRPPTLKIAPLALRVGRELSQP